MARTIYSGVGTPEHLNIGTVLKCLQDNGIIPRINERLTEKFPLTGEGLTDLLKFRANLTLRCFKDYDAKGTENAPAGFATFDEYKRGLCEDLAYEAIQYIKENPNTADVLRGEISRWLDREDDEEIRVLRDKCKYITAAGDETEETLELIFLAACERNNSGLRKGRKKAPAVEGAENVDIPSLFSAVDEVKSAVEKIVSNPFLMRKPKESVITDIKNTDSIMSALGISGKSVFSSVEGFDGFAKETCSAMAAEEKSLLSLVSLFPCCSMDASAAEILTEKEREAMFALQQRGVLVFSKDMTHLTADPAYRLLMEYTDSYDRHIKSHEQKARDLLGMTLKGEITPDTTAHVLLALDFDGRGNTEISMLMSLLKYWVSEKKESLHDAAAASHRLKELAQKEKIRAGGIMDGIIAFAEEVIRIGKEN